MDTIDIITFFEDSDGTMLIGAEYGVYIYENGTARVAEEITNQLFMPVPYMASFVIAKGNYGSEHTEEAFPSLTKTIS